MRRKNRNSQIITIIVLLVCVLGISVGFAAFSNVLTVKPGATITPDESTFSVDFSSSSTSLITNPVAPILTPDTLNANSAVIDNSGDPTITGFKVDFTQPGQTAVYKFYAFNNGEYTAHLTNINFLNVESEDSHKVCKTIYGTLETEVTAACDDITMTVQVGGLTVTDTTTGITGRSIAKGASHEIIITIEYKSGSTPTTGDFSTRFGSIELEYTSTPNEAKEITFEISVDRTCTYPTTYTALEGMTFSEWVESDYNIHGFIIKYDRLYFSGGDEMVWGPDYTVTTGDEYIQESFCYTGEMALS